MKHGLSYNRFHRIWRAIVLRCANKSNPIYGGRGITVGWKSFEEFFLDMNDSYLEHCELHGEKNTSIDRIDVNGNYSKDNCRWATRLEQNNNRRSNHMLEYQGKTQSLADWSREVGLTYDTIKLRVRRGWSVEKVLSTPRKVNQYD